MSYIIYVTSYVTVCMIYDTTSHKLYLTGPDTRLVGQPLFPKSLLALAQAAYDEAQWTKCAGKTISMMLIVHLPLTAPLYVTRVAVIGPGHARVAVP